MSTIVRLPEARRNEIRSRLIPLAAKPPGCPPRSAETRCFASIKAHFCRYRPPHLTDLLVMPVLAARAGGAKSMVGPQGLQLGNLMATLVVDQITGKPKVRFRADSLITGLWIQLGHALSEGATFRECRYCGTLFKTGPGSGRRFDAQFCSDQHRVTFNSHKRSKAAANA